MSSVRVAECETAADVWRVARESEARRKKWNRPKQQPPKPPPPPPKEPEPEIVQTEPVWMGRNATEVWTEMMANRRKMRRHDELSIDDVHPRPLLDDVIRAVARAYGFRSTDLKAARRDHWACQARHVSMLICKLMTLRSLPKIARAHGNRDHTTVLNAVQKLAWLAPQLLALHTLADPPSAWAASAARLHPLPAMARTYIRRAEEEAS